MLQFVALGNLYPPVPPRKNTDGNIMNTPLQLEIQLKIGSPVMLTYNIDTLDSLTNGAVGEVKGFEQGFGNIKSFFVHFKHLKVGRCSCDGNGQ